MWCFRAVAADALNAITQTQIDSLMAEKEARTPAEQKMDSQLVYFAKQSRNQTITSAVPTLRTNVRANGDGRVLLDIKATVSDGLLDFIAQLGGIVVNHFAAYDAIRARLPVAAFETLAARPDVRFVEPAAMAIANTGSVTSEGDRTHRANTARATFPTNGGSGVKVGVLSTGVDSLAASIASGNLNASATVIPGQAGSGNEGTAMMEIVQDIVPNAQIYFATGFNGAASMAANIQALQAAGCTVIVDDVTYFYESPFQEAQPISQAVRTVSDAGVMYFSCAANFGNKDKGTSGTWEGDFADGGAASVGIKAGRVHNFGGGVTSNIVVSTPNLPMNLFWSDPLGASTNDYDLFVVDAFGNVVVASTTIQNGTQDPYETISPLYANDRIVIVKTTAAASRFLHLDTSGSKITINTAGNVRGHNAAGAANAFSVAATNVANSPGSSFFVGGATNPVETFSSDGPRRIFYNPNGTAITPGNFLASGGQVLNKPDFTAADGVVTSVPGFNPFFGTSAAAPHAAAIAALIKSYNPALAPSQIRTILTGTALDIEGTGYDRDSGSGIISALAAIQAAQPTGVTVTVTATQPTAGEPNSGQGPVRFSHTTTLLSTAKVLIAGGTSTRGSSLSGAELYDPVTGAWTPTGPLSDYRSGHTATLLDNGKVLVAGGINDGGALASAELYDPVAGTWAATGAMHAARRNYTATLLSNGKVLVAGGDDASAELYNPATGTWTATGAMTVVRTNHTATLLPNGKVLVAGGGSGSVALASAELYDPTTGTWTATGALGTARYVHTATLLSTGKVLVAGGGNYNGSIVYLASAELYNPTTGTWTATGAMNAARYVHTAAVLSNGKVLVAGGYIGAGGLLASAELYDPTAGNWTTTGALNTARYIHTATALSSGKVLVAGGLGLNQYPYWELYDATTGLWTTAGMFTFTRTGSTGSALPVNFTVGGTATGGNMATLGSDYIALGTSVTIPAGLATATKTVSVLADTVVEGDETVVVTLASGSGYTVGTPASATVTIKDGALPPTITVNATDATAGEPGSSQGSGTFTFSRSGWTTESLWVPFTASGTATNGTDYTALAGYVGFAANSATATQTVSVIDDTLPEASETVIVTLDPYNGPNYTVGSPASATVTILDDDSTIDFVTSVALGTLRNDFTGFVGTQIAVGANPLKVSELGRIVAPGNGGTHLVKLVKASDGLDVPDGAVSISMSGGTAGQFRYGVLSSPVTLAANTTYWVLSQEVAGGDTWYDWNTTLVTSGAAASSGIAWGTGPGSWATYTVANHSFGPVNFRYSIITPTPYVTSSVAGTLRNNYSGWVGMQITAGVSPLTVSELGRITVAGNVGTHTVKLVKASDGLDVPGGTVTISMSGGTAGQFRYGVLSSPVTLAAGTTYWVLSQEVAGGDTWYDWNATLTTTGAAAANGIAWGTGPGGWSTYAVANQAFGPVNFKYTATPATTYVTGLVPGTLRNNYSGWVGMQIVVGASSLTVGELGRITAAGNVGTHTVKLVKASDGLDVPGGTVTISMSGGTAGQFRFGNLSSPVTLAASTTYWVLSQEVAGGDTWYDWNTTLTTTGAAAANGIAWDTGPGGWATYPVANQAFAPVNFKYAIATAGTIYVTGLVPGTTRNDYSGWVGMQIKVGASPLTVRELGRIKASGNVGTHSVKLVKATDGLDVLGGTVTIAMSAGTTGQFQFGILNSPVTLAAGATYWVLSQETAGGDSWYDWNTTVTTTGVAADNAVAWGTGPGGWSVSPIANQTFGPVNFKY